VNLEQVLLQATPIAQVRQGVGQGASEQLEIGLLELGAGAPELAVKARHALRRDETRLDVEGIDGFDDVVIGAGAHGVKDLVGVEGTGDDDDVGVMSRDLLAHPATERGPVESGQSPIGEQQIDVAVAHQFPRTRPVTRHETVVAQPRDHGLEQRTTGCLVIGDQYPHVSPSSPRSARSSRDAPSGDASSRARAHCAEAIRSFRQSSKFLIPVRRNASLLVRDDCPTAW